MARRRELWLRITDGLLLNQLWRQFQADARSSYRLYSQDVRSSGLQQTGRQKYVHTAQQFAWAVFEKISPARRVLLLFALLLLFLNVDAGFEVHRRAYFHLLFPGSFWGGLLMLALLVLEVADRVVMKRDLQIAKEIQAWLLPAAPPEVPGLEVAFATRPANTVAGDYYDVFARPHENSPHHGFVIAIADVAGKSIPAALLMATFQASLKTLSKTPGSLVDLVRDMNSYVCSNSQSGRRFITTFLSEFDPLTKQLTYVNCGQNPPILRRQSGAVERLDAGGVPLGVFGGVQYESATISVWPGDVLLLFTDGVSEAEDHRTEEYGEGRLMNVLHNHHALRPPQLLSSILDSVDRFVGDAPQHDDITLMVLRFS